MKVVLIYLKIYADSLLAAFGGIRRNLWTLLLPMALLAVTTVLGMLLAPLGFVGGLLLAFALDALMSCYLYFVGEIVASTQVRMSEFRRSIGAYFWSIVNVNFVLFIADLLLGTALANNPQGPAILGALWWAAFIALNATPEVLYQKGTYGGIDTFRASFAFLQENWIEWLVPNVLLGAGGYFLFQHVLRLGLGGLLAFALIGGPLLHLIMLFRGHLFRALDGTSHRQRMYKARMGL